MLELGFQRMRLYQPHEFGAQLAGWATLQLHRAMATPQGRDAVVDWCAGCELDPDPAADPAKTLRTRFYLLFPMLPHPGPLRISGPACCTHVLLLSGHEVTDYKSGSVPKYSDRLLALHPSHRRMCQLIVENGGDPELTQFGGHAFVSCDSIAPLFQVLRIQVRKLPAT